MTQVPLSSHIVEKLQPIATERGVTLSELIEQIVEDYLSSMENDQASEPEIGLIDNLADLASNTKEVLLRELKSQSGWTQKADGQ